MTALVLLMFITLRAIIIGVLQLYAAAQLWKVIDNAWWLILSGLLSIGFRCGAHRLARHWSAGGHLDNRVDTVFFGCMLIGLSFELKKFKRT